MLAWLWHLRPMRGRWFAAWWAMSPAWFRNGKVLRAGSRAWIAILATVLLLNLRHVLYGLSLNEVLPARTRPPRPVLAHFLTDENYGLTIKDYLDGRGSAGFMFGSGVSLLGCFVTATVAGVALGNYIPDSERLGLDFVFPLTFLALLLPLIRLRRDLLVAAIAGAAAVALSRITSGGVTILVATVLAAGAGALLPARGPAA